MRSFLQYAALFLIIAIGAVFGYATTKPDTFEIERSLVMAAPASEIYAHIADLRAWEEWSPYEGIDPNLKRTYSGEKIGKGSSYSWEGNGEVGAGRMQITQVSPPTALAMRIDFERPIEGHNTVDFTLAPEGKDTRVTWSMHGPQPYITKVISVFVDLDSLLGADFEKGLANLKSVVER